MESKLLWTVGTHFVFLPWALGAATLWSQILSLLLSTFSLGLAAWPRCYDAELTGGPEFKILPGKSLIRFPVFWFGLALLGLVALQGLNPAWEYRSVGDRWWLQVVPHARWLPHGIRGPLSQSDGLPQGGPWRTLLLYASAWATTCAAWIGFTRRRALQRLFIVLAANGAVLGLIGICQRMLGSNRAFGLIDSPNVPFASFLYKNHAGAYLVLMAAIGSGLGAWYHLRAVRRLAKSSPAAVFAFCVVCIAIAVFVSFARGATFALLGYLAIMVVTFFWFQTRIPAAARNPLVFIVTIVAIGWLARTGLVAIHGKVYWAHLEHALSVSDTSVESRTASRHATVAMLADYGGLGAGAGCFAFLFPPYQRRVPLIANDGFWPHAHNDILEIPLELGIIGAILTGAMLGYWIVCVVRTRAWRNPLGGCILLGIVAVVAMSWGDYIFYNAAILVTWCGVWPMCIRWVERDEPRPA